MRRKMRKFLSCFLVMIFFISIINPAVFAEDVTPSIVTEVGGVISKNTIWTKEGSPYKLTGNLLISKGAKLTIDEGVRVIGDSSNEFTVLGRIDSLGSEAEKVIFDGFNFIKLSSSKNNINNTTFLNTSLVIAGDKNVVSNSIFKYDYLTSRQYNSITSWGGENCIVSSVVDGGIDIRDTRTLDGYNGYSEFNIISSVVKNKNNTSVSSSGNVKISDSVISDSNVGIQGAIEIVRTKIENNKSGVLLGNWASISDSEFINNDVAIDNGQNITPFKNNSFINNKMNLKMAVTYNPAISTLEAGKNYWGSTDETEIKSKIYDFLDNPGATYVDYSDFFTQHVPVVSVESVDLTNDIVYSPSLESKNLKAEIFPKNSSNQTLKWKSLNPEIADVLANGKVIAKGTGVATIVIESEDGLFSDSCKVVIGGSKQITNNAPINGSISNFSNIGLAGDFLVWNQNASYASTNYYNLKTDETKELTKSNETSWSSTIYKNKLVYNKNVNGMDQLFLYDLTTHNTNQLTNESSWAISPMIFGNKLVYIAYRNGECVILKDLESGADSQISPTFYNVESPRIYNNHIVYLGQGNGYPSGIYIFNTITNETNMIPDTANINNKNFDIYGNKVYFANGREIFVYNIDTKEKLKIKDLGEEYVSTLRVNKNRIVWSSYSGITLYDTETKLTSKIGEAFNISPYYTDEIMIDDNRVAWKGEGNGYPQIYVLDLLPSPEAKPMIFNVNGLNDISDFVEGEAEPGLTIEFWSDSHLVGNGTSDENGGFHISIPKQKDGTVLVAVATDDEGNTSDSIRVVVQDATGPDAPVVNEVSDNSLYVTGTSEPDSIVNVYNNYGILGTAVTNGNGEFSLTLSRKQTAGTELIINATDTAGNQGKDKMVTVVDKTPPQVGVGNQTDQSTHVVGAADPGSTITIKVNDVVIATGSNPGQYTFAIPIPRQKAGTKLYVYATDSAGNTSEPEIVIVKDVTAPEKPIVHEVIDRSTSVTGLAEVGSSITVKSGSVVIGLGTADEKGQFSVSIQKQILGTKLNIYSSDSAGNNSEPTETIVQDGTGPDVPQVDIVTDKSIEITGLSEPDALIKVKSNGNIIGTTYTDNNGHFTVSIPKQKVDTILVVTSTDSSGNESEPFNITVLDATNPSVPIVLEVTNTSTSINGYAEVGSTVYCKVGSTIIGSSITNQQGEFSITISKQLAGTKLSISSTDVNGNTSESVEIVVSDVISPVAPQVDEVSDLSKMVTGKAEAGSLVKVKVGNVLIGSSIADENGRFSVVIFEQIANTKLRISATDTDGNESESLEVTVLDKTAPIVTEIQDGAIINHDISIIFNEGKATLNGEAIESGAKITSNGNYNLVVTDEAGNKTSISFTIRKPFEVNFLVDGGLYEKVSVYDHDLVVSPTEPAKTGYTFGGWYKDSAYTLAWDFAKDTVQANNITLYAKWTINSYTVNFDSKGGSAVPDINAKYNAKITAPTPPTKVGYTFGGWYKDAAYTTAWDFENDTIPATNITLYVKWATNSHTVTFDSQGGSAVTGITAEYNAKITAPESPTKIGYTFGGWYKDAAFTTEWDFENDTVSAINITLYAKWIINRYTVTFDSQGGSDVTGIHANYHSKITAPTPPIKVGYTFGGWYKDTSNTTAWDFVNDIVPANNITLYAKWTINRYTVNFDSQGGSAVTGINTDYHSKITAPMPPTKIGYTFGGWYKDAACTTEWDFENDTLTSSNIILYAKWTINSYTVNFNSQGGSVVNDKIANYQSTITAPTSPTKEGYTFGGWYKDAACTMVWDFVNDIVPATNITLYAKWTANSYTVNFDSQDGSAVLGFNANYHSKITAPTAPTKVGYTFGGWYKDGACTTAWDFANDTITASNITLYAKWTIISYTVNFDRQGGSAVTDIHANYHSTITAPESPTKVGYTFGGWYKDGDCTTAWDFVNDIVPATNITLYAKWITNNYTVNFDSQGGSAVTGIYANYHSKITAPTAPTKVGYTFGGWYKDAGCTTEWDFANDTVSNNTTLYAKWNINSYTVTFNSQGGSTVKSVKVNYNSLIQTPTSPTRAGYTFVGWYKEPSGVNVWSFATQKVLNNTTLYAKWVANPTNPTNVKAVSSSYNSVNVSWGAITGASGYEIYRATSSGGNYSLLTSITKNSFSNTGLTANNMYYYKVRAYKLVGSTKVYSGWSVVVSAKPIPSTPVGLKLVKATTTSIKATWTVVTGATKYEVWVATSSTGVFAKKAEVSSATGTITGLSRGKTYYIKVRAYRLIGKTKVYSGYSKVAVLKI